MEQPALSVVGQDRCSFLYWKGLFIEAEWDPSVPRSERIFWCQKTYNCLGPDGKVVDEYECSPARGCYKGL
ncbi:MAG: hypothetical protein HYR60_04145 [Acidobacteria bacterium]|nr:hypothetical protein [Acidobacteriota bacterium]MBI3469962.1 hypothetical protein [Candidatus Solibacter usitatus]